MVRSKIEKAARCASPLWFSELRVHSSASARFERQKRLLLRFCISFATVIVKELRTGMTWLNYNVNYPDFDFIKCTSYLSMCKRSLSLLTKSKTDSRDERDEYNLAAHCMRALYCIACNERGCYLFHLYIVFLLDENTMYYSNVYYSFNSCERRRELLNIERNAVFIKCQTHSVSIQLETLVGLDFPLSRLDAIN